MARLSLFLVLFLSIAVTVDAYVDIAFVRNNELESEPRAPIMTIGRFREPICQCCSSRLCRRKPCPCPRFPL